MSDQESITMDDSASDQDSTALDDSASDQDSTAMDDSASDQDSTALDDNCKECSACKKAYSKTRAPRNLACGHLVCHPCLIEVIDYDNACPVCREDFEVEEVEKYSINHPVLRLSRIFQFANPGSENEHMPTQILSQPDSEQLQSNGTCPIHDQSLFFSCLTCKVWICRGCLVDHSCPPHGFCVIDNIQGALSQIKARHQKILAFYLKGTDTMNENLQDIVSGCDALIKHHENWKNNKSINLNYQQNIDTLIRQREETKSQFDVLEKLKELLKQGSEKIEEATSLEDVVSASATCKDCESAYEEAKDLADISEAGLRVYGILEDDGESRWSHLAVKDNKILLYSLKDGRPPKSGVNLPYELLRSEVPQESPVVFMDFGWNDEFKRRVYFQMYGDTPRGRQAVFLCSGEKGPSYRDTLFYDTFFHEDEDPCMKGGDYENNDGSGGRAVVDDITDDEVYSRYIYTGMLAGWPVEDEHRLGSFRLYTFDYGDDLDKNDYVFGIATGEAFFLGNELGVDDLRTWHKPKVIDCGLAIDL